MPDFNAVHVGPALSEVFDGENWDFDAYKVRPCKVPITVRLDPDIVTFLKSLDGRYQTRINAVLRAYMDAAKRSQPTTST